MRLQRRTSPTSLRLAALVGIGALVAAGCGEASAPKKTAPAPSAPKANSKPVSVGAAQGPAKAAPKAAPAQPTVAPKAAGARPKAANAAPGPKPVQRARVVPKKVTYPPFEGDTITVIHTANMVGEIEPCG